MSLMQKCIRSAINNVTKSNNVVMIRLQHNDAGKDIIKGKSDESSAQQIHTVSPTITKIKLTKLDKFLVQRYSSANYKSVEDVPDVLSSTQVNFARDKGRAKMSIILILCTVAGALFTINLAKYHKKQGKSTYCEDMNKQHAEYSKMHLDQIRNTHKN